MFLHSRGGLANWVRTFVRGVVRSNAAGPCAGDPLCLDVGKRPLLKNVRRGLIDPDTPDSVKTIKSADGKDWKLVVRAVSALGLRC